MQSFSTVKAYLLLDTEPVYQLSSKMDKVIYESVDDIANKLSKLQNNRPFCCSGYRFQKVERILNAPPVPGLHFDPNKRKPITILCEHKSSSSETIMSPDENGALRECQSFSEVIYILIAAYARGEFGDTHWKALFPTRGDKFPGAPNYTALDPRFPNCLGFKKCLGPAINKLDNHHPNTIRAGWQINPTNLCMYAKECNHLPCEYDGPFYYALFRAFGSGLLMDLGFSPYEESNPLKGTNLAVK